MTSICIKCKNFKNIAKKLGFCKKQKLNVSAEYLATIRECPDFEMKVIV